MAPFSKPETVLKQAEGLVSVGQTHAALQSLTEMFASKRFRSTPLTSLEPIMHRFIELCVEMRKGRPAKEGLMQYKNIAQNTNVQSIESVITRFVQLADAKVREAQEKAQIEIQNQQVGLDVDDLEASETPESILLGAVSGDQSKDRTDRALVTPWLKFLWESYRTSLETLKNNARLEVIYQNIAQQAFKFCLTHQRKVEFRRLCETLRLHLSNVAKYSHQPHSINLSDPDTLQHHLDTRFAQLYTSVELELWQEAFRSVEDVHNLLTLAKKAPKPSMMANYYEKLTKIFLMSGNSLYHAAAWGKYYQIVTSMGGKSEEELSRLASQVLVSALAVPVGLQTPSEGGSLSGDQDNDGEASSSSGKGRTGRLTALLGLSRTPNRSGLLRDALSRDVLRLVPPHIKSLYNILEITFDPLTLCSSIAPLLKTLSSEPDYKPYLPLLHQALLSRLLSHLSQIYSSMKLDALLDLTKPLVEQGVEGAYGETQVEAYIMGCARRGELNVRVDHKEGCLIFLDEAFGTSSPGASTSASASYGESGDRIQAPISDLVRTRLSNVASCLYSSLQVIDPPPSTPSPSPEDHLTNLITAINTERRALSLRLSLTHRRRELVSELVIRKEKEESFRRSEQSRLAREASERKAREELRLREAERNKRERERIRVEEAKKYAQGLVETGLLKEEELEKMKESMGERFDTENLISIQVTQLEKEKRETSTKLKTIAKRLDHLERAYRKEERPLLEMDYERQQLMDRQTFDAVQIARKEGARAKFKEDIATKARLGRMLGDYEKRRDELVGKKKDEYERRKEVARKKIEEEKAKRRKAFEEAEREERRQREEEERTRREKEEEERRLEEERLAEEERQREEAEAAARAEEEAKRAAEEKVAKARKDREAERAAAIEQARLQQQREEEAEERRRQRKTTAPTTSTTPTGSVSRAGGDNVWRRGTNVASNGASTTPPRTESPAPGAAGKYRPGAFSAASGGGGGGGGGATGGGWRAREEARRAAAGEGGASTPRPESPAPAKAQEKDDGFQVVGAKKEGVWRPRRGR